MTPRLLPIISKLLLLCLPFCYIRAATAPHGTVPSKLANKYNVARMKDPYLMLAAIEELSACQQEFERCGFFVAKSPKDLDRYFHEKKFADGAWAVDIHYHPNQLVAKASVTGRRRLFGYIITFFSLLKYDPFFPYARKVKSVKASWFSDTKKKYQLLDNTQQALEDDTVYHALIMYLQGLYQFLTEPTWKGVLKKANTTVKQEVEAYNAYWHKHIEKGKIVFQTAFGLLTAYEGGTPLYYTQQPVRDLHLRRINRTNELLPMRGAWASWCVTKQSYASWISRWLISRGPGYELTGFLFRPLSLSQGARTKLDALFLDLSWHTLPCAERISAYWFRTKQASGVFPQVLYTQISAYVGRFPYQRYPEPKSFQLLQAPPDTTTWMTFTNQALYQEATYPYEVFAEEMRYEKLYLPPSSPWYAKREQQGYKDKSSKAKGKVILSNAIPWQDGICGRHYYLPLHRSDSPGYAWLSFGTQNPHDILSAFLLSESGGFIKLVVADIGAM